MKFLTFYLSFAFLIIIAPTCTRKTADVVPQSYEQTTKSVPLVPEPAAGNGQACCRATDSYIPPMEASPEFPVRKIRVNFHVMYDGKGENNIPKEKARKIVKDILYYANIKWKDNCKLNLPPGNVIPDLPINLLLQLTPQPDVPGDTGIYLHDDEELCYYIKGGRNDNRSRTEVIKKYGIGIDSILNVFVMPHHPDSIKSSKYRADIAGIALRRSGALKISGWHANPETKPWETAKNLNHEVAHMLTLNHSWYKNDGCDDTMPNPNCWWQTNNGSACDSLYSNNLMDYNAGSCALSPCQIGRMHRCLSLEKDKQRRWLVPEFCAFNPLNNITVTDSLHWAGAKDLTGNITVADGGVLMLSCRVSMAEYAEINVLPGGKLILNNNRIHNACGKQWGGINIYKNRRKTGEVVRNGSPVFENTEPIVWEAQRRVF